MLEEVKIRLLIVRHYLDTPKDLIILHPWHIRETCCLQFRMICELIALGCLLMHGDMDGADTNKLRKAYQADMIVERLQTLHFDFYPIPMVFHQPLRVEWYNAEYVHDGYLTKNDLQTLWRQCGINLHIGSLEKLFTDSQRADGVEDLKVIYDKITRLLAFHKIILKRAEVVFWFKLGLIENERVTIWVAHDANAAPR